MKTKLLLFFFFLIIKIQAQVLESYSGASGVFQPNNYINFNNKMYYFGRSSGYQWSLYSTDGTATGNQVVKNLGIQVATIIESTDLDIKYNTYKAVYNNKLYFTTGNQQDLWQSDGTTTGTNIFTTNSYFGAKYFIEFNGRLYFTAQNSTSGREVWSTDGTVAGTTLLKDIYPGTNPSIDPQFDPHFTILNNKLFFVANDGTTGFELWSTDGTTAGTSLFKDIRTSASETESNIYNQGAFKNVSNYSLPPFKVVNNKLYFCANSDYTYQFGGDFKLFSTDGTASGTDYIAVPIPAGSSAIANYISGVYGLTVVNSDIIVFGATLVATSGGGTNSSTGIFKLDSSNNVTALTGAIAYSGDSGSGPDTEQMSMKLYNGEFYFIGYPNFTTVAELWKMNPTTYQFSQVSNPATQQFINFNTNNGFTRLLLSQVWDGKLYFSKANSSNGGLFSTTGTLASTTQVAKGTSQNTVASLLNYGSSGPTELQNFGSGMYFGSKLTSSQFILWRIYNSNLATNTFVNTENKFKIYPNPTSNTINMNFDANLENASVKIISVTGQTVLDKQSITGNDFSLDVSSILKGIYIIQITDENSSYTMKFLKN